jgi:D-alanine-D-alanine ligase
MRILILFNAVGAEPAPDELDVLHQVEAIEAALLALGHEVRRAGCDLDLARVKAAVEEHRPELVFNLVESLEGTARLLAVVPGLLDALGVRYTGSRAEPLYVTTHKLLTKERLEAAGLPTPRWYRSPRQKSPGPFTPGRYIVKSIWEHASLGLTDEAVVQASGEDELQRAIERLAPRMGGEAFAELYVAGREFNVGLLSRLDGARPEVLPPAEILFVDYPDEKPRIVGYHSKWLENSFEYQHTPRRLDFGPDDAALLERLYELGERAWALFGLEGYARVDFRVDARGEPWLLEVNANPCLSPDAGFAVMVERANQRYADAVARIVAAALP